MQKPSRTAALELLLVSAGLALAVSYRFFEPIWHVDPGLIALGALTALAYAAGFLACRRIAHSGPFRILAVTVVVSQPVLLALLLLGLPVSRPALVFELVLLFIGLVFASAHMPAALRVGLAVAFAGAAAYPSLVGFLGLGGSRSLPGSAAHYVFSSYLDLGITEYTILESEPQDGGALTLLPDGRLLLVAGSGESRILRLDDGLEVSAVDLHLPIDIDSYRAGANNPTPYYRVTDVLYTEGRLFASYTQWDAERNCHLLRLVEAEFDGRTAGPWKPRFESEPCVEGSSVSNQTGGRIAVLDSSHVLLTLGTFGKTAVEDTDYGKIVELNTTTWRPEVFTRGHRNPQGLLVADSRVWSTEHGPDGGDELNLIESGSDYGWPSVSYGTDYGSRELASGSTPGDHSGFRAPVYAWLPSVAVSNLIEIGEGAFAPWEGDLLIASLSGLGHGRSLFRVRLVDRRAVSVERIHTGRTIRDLREIPGGPLVLWDGKESVQVVRPADHVFAQCSSCHSVRYRTHGIGPDLWGVVGSTVARHPDYEYSQAMRDYGGTWTKTRLDRFLEDPGSEIPGTTMDHDGIEDPAERARVIEYLEDVRSRSP